jgi:hypothetical protein
MNTYSQRATIAYAEEEKRMRIGYDFIANGQRGEHWVSFIPTEYNGELDKRCTHFKGALISDPRSTQQLLSWDTRILELETAKLGDVSNAAYDLWKEHYGPVRLDPTKAKQNQKRRSRAQTSSGKGSAKRQRTTTSSSPMTSVETKDMTDGLADDQVLALFGAFDDPFSLKGYRRIIEMYQACHRLLAPPPLEMFQNLRDRAKTWAKHNPADVWTDRELVAWTNTAPRIPEEAPRALPYTENIGEAYTTVHTRVNATLDKLAEYRRRWLEEKDETKG